MKTPKVFISATSHDLADARKISSEALLSMRCMPIVQENFPPDTRSVCEMLRSTISECDAVLHIAGFHYGAEPNAEDGSPRRSYTQLEYHVARDLNKPIYVFLPEESFPFDHPPKNSELGEELQLAHRTNLKNSGHLYVNIPDSTVLEIKVRELNEEVKSLRLAADKTKKRFLGTAWALILILSSLVVVTIFNLGQGDDHRSELSESRKIQDETNANLKEQKADLREVKDTVKSIKVVAPTSTPERLKKLLEDFAFKNRINLDDFERETELAASSSSPQSNLFDRETNQFGMDPRDKFLLDKYTASIGRESNREQTISSLNSPSIEHQLLASKNMREKYRIGDLAWKELSDGNAETALSAFLFVESLENKKSESRIITQMFSGSSAPTNVLYGIGESFRALGRNEESFPYYRLAIIKGESTFGRDDDYVAEIINSYGIALIRADEFRKAVGAFQVAIARMEKSGRKDDFRLISFLTNVSTGLRRSGEIEDAELVSIRVIETLLAMEEARGKKMDSRELPLQKSRSTFEASGKSESEIEALLNPKSFRKFSEIPRITLFLEEQIGAARNRIIID